jgi:hypothetical protein
MHASVYVRPIRKPPDFDRFDATVRSATAHNFKETFEAGQQSPARIRPLQQGANTFSCGVFRRLEQEAGQQSPAAGLCMILERASHQIHQKFMVFRPLETGNSQFQRQQQRYVEDALTFQFSGIFMPQLDDDIFADAATTFSCTAFRRLEYEQRGVFKPLQQEDSKRIRSRISTQKDLFEFKFHTLIKVRPRRKPPFVPQIRHSL